MPRHATYTEAREDAYLEEQDDDEQAACPLPSSGDPGAHGTAGPGSGGTRRQGRLSQAHRPHPAPATAHYCITITPERSAMDKARRQRLAEVERQEAAARLPYALEAAEALREYMGFLTPEARLAVVEAVMQGYCVHCGAPAPCHCWNDECGGE